MLIMLFVIPVIFICCHFAINCILISFNLLVKYVKYGLLYVKSKDGSVMC